MLKAIDLYKLKQKYWNDLNYSGILKSSKRKGDESKMFLKNLYDLID